MQTGSPEPWISRTCQQKWTRFFGFLQGGPQYRVYSLEGEEMDVVLALLGFLSVDFKGVVGVGREDA